MQVARLGLARPGPCVTVLPHAVDAGAELQHVAKPGEGGHTRCGRRYFFCRYDRSRRGKILVTTALLASTLCALVETLELGERIVVSRRFHQVYCRRGCAHHVRGMPPFSGRGMPPFSWRGTPIFMAVPQFSWGYPIFMGGNPIFMGGTPIFMGVPQFSGEGSPIIRGCPHIQERILPFPVLPLKGGAPILKGDTPIFTTGTGFSPP